MPTRRSRSPILETERCPGLAAKSSEDHVCNGYTFLPQFESLIHQFQAAINGMYLVRPSEIEINAWQALISSNDAEAASAWSWDSFFAASKKSETFTPPSPAIQAEAGIQYDESSHGTDGPLHYSYPD